MKSFFLSESLYGKKKKDIFDIGMLCLETGELKST